MGTYNFSAVETKWNGRWKAASRSAVLDPSRKFYNLVEFPYPSAEGLHVGHVYTYSGADTLGRYHSMHGRQVFQPIGWDSFGIHTENYAMKTGESPEIVTNRATKNYKRQLERIGVNWTWDTELRTDDPEYYRWTQWIFLQLYRAGLAERKESPVIWCPSCLTVLAFEQVDGDKCERCDSQITNKTMRQWYLKITDYADQLLEGLDSLDWPDDAKRLQRNWIGRTEGLEVRFALKDSDSATALDVFTTRCETIFGVSFVALSPLHPNVPEIAKASSNRSEIEAYVAAYKSRSSSDRFSATSGPVGVETDAHVVHPLTGALVPVIVADYVLASHATGAVMGVPAHDERDARVADSLGIPGPKVLELVEDSEILVNSARYSGMRLKEAQRQIADDLIRASQGRPATHYRLHDWLVSRQRYWGSPIPIVYCPSCGEVPVPEADLPITLPSFHCVDQNRDGRSPLATVKDFVETECPRCGRNAQRETDVLDTFVESSWYFLRYPSIRCANEPWSSENTRHMLPVDMYSGGREHSTRHHLYARFITRALYELGYLEFPEPFTKLRLHGTVIKDGAKMSKSRGNVINPDEYLDRVGADNLRGYLLFCGPWEVGGDFSDKALSGMVRFTDRVWNLLSGPSPSAVGGSIDMSTLDRAITKVGTSIENLKFNTAIAELMSLRNWLQSSRDSMSCEEWSQARDVYCLLLAPFLPYLSEELWETFGHADSIHSQRWPQHNEHLIPAPAAREIPVQVNGRIRARLHVKGHESKAQIRALIDDNPAITRVVGDRNISDLIYVPGKIVNLVVTE
ncbi:Leucine--tRNA ligase [Austwickia sp. TVS 96-490-7B]|uniref:leucine--tRNA ligase n=1 Tax=Austwickia sp. TVS 96-490-7B TaxID=2830843 RepID=UPI001C59B5B3|nr:leucine--tRNA ligase [Austwickia sp. TVS 96-490-7B]MBW3086343.1 Leucine--tRNA ligase [Austwickia sp. TVS 96-490-7B]